MPGLIQTHVHLCQTLFRGLADDLVLMDWLRTRVWPLEAAHTPASLRASARLAACELLLGGTTAVLTMETVHDTDVVCEEIAQSGLRATIGKCLMDADPDVPARLREPTQTAIDEALALKAAWDGKADGRLRIAFAPRFAVSCSRELLEAVGALSARDGMLVHTHASESRGEVDLVRARTGMDNLPYLATTGLVSPRLCAAHCVWVDDEAQALIAGHDVKVMHCPGSNLKLGSGLAPVVELRRSGVTVSLGADGAACNNRLDMFGGDAAGGRASSGPPGTWPAVRARRGVDGHARTAPARSGSTPRSARSRSASAPTSSWSAAGARTRRRRTIPTRRWSTPPRPATSGRPSSTGACWSTRDG